jgi:hypothetical protein
MNDPLEQSISKAKQLANWLAAQVDGLELHGGLRGHLAGGCFFVALEHHCAVITLTERGLIPSALALIRPQFEAYLRGCWLAFVCSEDEVERFVAGGLRPKAEQIVEALEGHEAFSAGVLRSVKTQAWPLMCDFTHTGIGQVSRNIDEGVVGRSYDVEEVIAGLEAASSWAILVVVGLASLAKDEALAQRAEECARKTLAH